MDSLQQFLQQQRQAHRMMNKAALPLPERRAQLDSSWQQATFPAGTTFEQEIIAGIRCEWLRCDASENDHPILVICHGGGYHIGSCLTHRAIAAQLAHHCQSQALTIDYRLAPEHKFPAAHDDAAAVVSELIQRNLQLVLVGDSGGAALAASTALSLKHLNICGLILMSPWLDADCQSDSYARFKAEDPAGNRGALRMMAVSYAGVDNLHDPKLSPIYSDQLNILPPTLLHVGGCETVLDETLLFVERAKAQGHQHIEYKVWPELIHGFHNWHRELEQSQRALIEIGQWFKRL